MGRITRVVLLGIGTGLVAGAIVGAVGAWLHWPVAVIGGAIGAVTGATVTSLQLDKGRHPPPS